MIKSVFGVCDQARLKSASTATESFKIKIGVSKYRYLADLPIACVLLFAYGKNRCFSHDLSRFCIECRM